MDMQQFWNGVTNKLSLAQLRLHHPAAFAAVKDNDIDLSTAEFCYDVIPNLGPGGASSEEDQIDFNERDPDGEIQDADGPSLSGHQALMVYCKDIDELFVFDNGELSLWNY